MFDVSYFFSVIPKIFLKVPITLEIALIATFFSLILGILIAVISYYQVPILNPLCKFLVSFMRGTPIVAHEISFARQVANRILFMEEGKIQVDAPPEEFFSDTKQERLQQFLSFVRREEEL